MTADLHAGLPAFTDPWTGRDAHALRSALRMSHAEFAAHLGVSARAVHNWKPSTSAVLRAGTQRLLDGVYEALTPAQSARFWALRSQARTGEGRS